VPYIGAWWAALRIVFGRRFQPLEWIPLAIGAIGVPAILLELIHDEALGQWLAGAWAMLPAPVIGIWAIQRWRRRRVRRSESILAF
jgi:hypothetical protein